MNDAPAPQRRVAPPICDAAVPPRPCRSRVARWGSSMRHFGILQIRFSLARLRHARRDGDDARAAWLLCERAVLAVNLPYASADRLARRVDDDGAPGPLEVAPVLGGGGLSIEGRYGAWMHLHQGFPWLFDRRDLADRLRRRVRRPPYPEIPMRTRAALWPCGSSLVARPRVVRAGLSRQGLVRSTRTTSGCGCASSRRCAPGVSSIRSCHTIPGCVNRGLGRTTSGEARTSSYDDDSPRALPRRAPWVGCRRRAGHDPRVPTPGHLRAHHRHGGRWAVPAAARRMDRRHVDGAVPCRKPHRVRRLRAHRSCDVSARYRDGPRAAPATASTSATRCGPRSRGSGAPASLGAAAPPRRPPATARSCGWRPSRCSTRRIRSAPSQNRQTVRAPRMAPPRPSTRADTWRPDRGAVEAEARRTSAAALREAPGVWNGSRAPRSRKSPAARSEIASRP